MAHHSHCDGCFSSNCSSNFEGCPIVNCPDCDNGMHSCKMDDHIHEICPESLVPCINYQNGCQAEVKRKQLCEHMSKCPIMLDQIIPSEKIECESCLMLLKETDLPDHRKICMEYKIPCINRHMGCPIKIKRKEMNHHVEHCSASVICCPYTYSRIGNKNFIHAGIRKLCADGYNPVQPDEKFLRADMKNKAYREPMTLDTYRWGRQPTCKYVRRDEFSNHWKSHIDFVDGLQDCIVRCPLFSYGCTYSITRFQPAPHGSILDYNMDIPSFVVLPSLPICTTNTSDQSVTSGSYAEELAKKQELLAYGYGDDIIGSIDVIGQLPVEVIMVIMSFCDSLSLWCLSQVNRYLREISHEIALKKGIMFIKWEKEGGSWKQMSLVSYYYTLYLLSLFCRRKLQVILCLCWCSI